MDRTGRPARIKDVAARAGVSPGLVSRLLNNDPTLTIRPETRQSVLDAVRDLDYVPDSTATALRKSRTDAIGLVLKHITNPVFADIVHGAQSAAAEVGCALLLIDADEVERGSRSFEAMLKAHRMDGLLLQGGYGPGDDLLLRYTTMVPSVIVNSTGTDTAAGVRLRDSLATRLATQYLVELGHEDIAFVAGPPSTASDTRIAGFVDALTEAGITPNKSAVIPAGWEADEGFAGVSLSIRNGYRPSAYVVGSSGAALGVLSALFHAGIRVPEDVSVIGVHDAWFTPYLSPALSTVALPLFELGRQSVLQLMSHIRDGKPDDLVIMDPDPLLVVRDSTARR